MPEFKHNFTGGKMNKDVDERLVPKGEYRDAMNIQVSTSEGSDVGTVQNILGNKELGWDSGMLPYAARCVGAIADEKNDALYWFVTSTNPFSSEAGSGMALDATNFTSSSPQGVWGSNKSMILQLKNGGITPVFVSMTYAAAYTLHQTGTNITWDSTAGTITFPASLSVADIEVGMTLQGDSPISGFPQSYTNMVVDSINTSTNTIVMNGDITWLDLAVSTQDYKETKLFFVSLGLTDTGDLLGFNSDNLITGINILDDMLFWTDGFTEPKKINIPRSIEGTDSLGMSNTRLINHAQGINYASNITVEEEHIIVIKRAPKTKLVMELISRRDPYLNYSGILQVSSSTNLQDSSFWEQRDAPPGNPANPYDFSTFSVVEGSNLMRIQIDSDLTGNTSFNLDGWETGSKVVLKPFDNNGASVPDVPITGYVIKGTIVPWLYTNSAGVTIDANHFTSSGSMWGVKVAIKIESIDGTPPVADGSGVLKYAIDLFDETEKLFEFKFPRFSYRYKYEDGEYSTFAPWTNVAFMPGSFDYHPKKGYNLGMSNNLQKLTLKNFITPDLPKDVVEIDILYKEDTSPNIHVVDTFSQLTEKTVLEPNGVLYNSWELNKFTIEEENIKAVLPSNQLLRPWDNLPRKAQTQEITGNRIVYGNYLQNYDLIPDVNPIFSHYLTANSSGVKSIKSLREYQLGIVFMDKYGRETPVITNNSGVFKIEKDKAVNKNKLNSSITSSSIPSEMMYFKFYIKETSGEYYNLAMDRWYDAEDNNVWLAFPSSDRNKVDIDTFLILKKGIAQSFGGVKETARYKILAIENEAPDFIKTKEYNIAEIVHDTGSSPIIGGIVYNDITSAPTVNSTYFHTQFDEFKNSSAAELDKITDDLYVEFSMVNDNRVSAKYKITEVVKILDSSSVPENFIFKIDGKFGDDVNFITNDPAGGTQATLIEDTTITRFYKRVIENSPQFDGRFFIKIYFDDVIQKYIKSPLAEGEDVEYSELLSQKIYCMSDSHINKHDDTSFGANSAVYGGSDPDSDITDCGVDYGGASAADWLYYTAYFADYNYNGSAEFTELGTRVTGGSTDVLDAQTSAATYEDVWFVDFGKYSGSYSSDWDGTNTYFNNSTSNGSSSGIVNSSSNGEMSLGFGGINVNPGKLWGEGPFYNLDRSLYNHMTPFIDSLNAGFKFRWKEDPTKTVYTIYASTTTKNIINYDDDWNNCTFQRMENFRKRYKFSFQPAMVWDPTENDHTIAIANGVKINGDSGGTDLTAMSTVTNVSYLDISTAQYNSTYDSGGGQENSSITPGLILYKINSSEVFNSDNKPVLIHSIEDTTGGKRLNFIGYTGTVVNFSISSTSHQLEFRQPAMNGLSVNSARNINDSNTGVGTLGSLTPGIGAVGYTLTIVNEDVSTSLLPADPAVWETEPKDFTDIDIYHEISGNIPLELVGSNGYTLAPVGSLISVRSSIGNYPTPPLQPNTTVIGWSGNIVEVSLVANSCDLLPGDYITFLRPDGSSVETVITGLAEPITSGACDNSFFLNINPNIRTQAIGVNFNWHNCYSFGNGVESNRVRDNFNQPFIANGVKASATLDEPYKEEHRKYGLIYSGLYNSTSGVNNLNQFIAAEKITKDINPIYGSIQKLYAGWGQGGDLIALCEDRILKILANKDALYNADGNTNVTSTNNVLGQAIPYSGEYGISKNPESFASEAYRIYFTDKVRGTVMRLSMDGLTPISNHGMKDWFRDNLKLGDKLIGSYDDKKDEYNITIKGNAIAKTVSFREDVRGWVSFKSFLPESAISCANEYYTFLYGKIWKHHNENIDANNFYLLPNDSSLTVIINEVPGSIKSFKSINYEGSQSRIKQFTTDPTTGLTDGEYYNLTPKAGWYVDSIFTDKESGTIDEFIEKEGKWFNYIKGIDVKVDGGTVSINPDGSSTFDQASFAIQGLGILNQPSIQLTVAGCTDATMWNYDPSANTNDNSCIPFIYGCSGEPTANNYDASANTEDGSCIWLGCYEDPCDVTNSFLVNPDYTIAYNYSVQNPTSNPLVPDGSCIYTVYGCTDPNGTNNYNPLANVHQVSCTDNTDPCIYTAWGCMYTSAVNWDATANTNDGTCTWSGCTEPLATNYIGFPTEANSYTSTNNALYGIQDDGSCLGGGCTDATANNYDAAATYDPLAGNGSCLYCELTTPDGNYDGIPVTAIDVADETVAAAVNGQIAVVVNAYAPYLPFTYVLTDSLGDNFYVPTPGTWLNNVQNPNSTVFTNLPPDTYSVTILGVNGFCSEIYTGIVVTTAAAPINYGCTNGSACNYDFSADATHVDDGSCEFDTCAGCTDPLANYPNPSWGNGAGTSYQTQTSGPFSNDVQCIIPGTMTAGPCMITCGGGGNGGGGSLNWCCGYTIAGCTDPTACNYTAAPNAQTVVDGSITCNYSGCTDPTANNYLPCATIDDGLCAYTAISGCTDAVACNYDAAATNDDGSCILGFAGVTIGDPNAVDNNGNSLALPFYWFDNGTNSPQLGDTIQNMVVGGYPVNGADETDVALSIQSLDPTMAQYNSGDSVRFQLREASNGAPPTNFNSIVDGPKIVSNTSGVVWNHQAGGAVLGDRSGNYVDPYPWGMAADSSSNYTFDYKHVTGGGYAMVKKFVVEVWSEINGVEYGRRNLDGTAGPTAGCGVWHEFTFTGYSHCTSPFANTGCTDPTACNYDTGANCDDGSCYFTTAQTWVDDPIDGCFECSQCTGSSLPACGDYNSDGSPVVILLTSCVV